MYGRKKSMAKTSAAQQRAVHKYVKNNYDRLELSVPKGEKVTIQQAAKQAGQSVNAYIYEAVCARMQQENAMSATPGVVKNPEDRPDSAE
jgi:predicted HicB family RNase H-like nuclease